MTDHNFDRFLMGLKEAMVRAQSAGRRRRQQSMLRRFGGGAPKATFSVPTWNPKGWQTTDVPLAELIQRHNLGISEIDIEIRCALRLVPAPGGRGPARVVVSVGGRANARHKLRILLRGFDTPEGEVRINDIWLRRFTGDSVSAPPGAPAPAFR